MHRPAIDIYSGPLVETTDSCLADLKKLFRTTGGTYIYAANGHGAWEAALSNTLSRGDKVLVLESGRFARNWGEMGLLPGLKGLMTPPGLSFVAVGDRAREAHQSADLRTRYWDWTQRDGPIHYMKYCGTPPEHLLFGLRAALDMIFDEGLDNVFQRHRVLAEAVRCAVSVWGADGLFEFNITEPAQRADSVTTVMVKQGFDPSQLLSWCETNAGVTLGIAIGDLEGRGFRIAHMGHVNAPMVLGTLGVIEAALVSLQWPAGVGGVQAAARYIGQSVPAVAK